MNLQAYIDKASILVEATPYIQQFRGEVFVVKLGGSVMEDSAALASLLADVAFMSTVGIKVVLVHGGGKAISRALDISGVKSEFVLGIRVTSEEAIGIVERVLKKEVNADIVRILRRNGANAHPLHGDWIIKAVRKTARPIGSDKTLDWGFVGEPVSVDARTITEMTDAGVIPVVTPLASRSSTASTTSTPTAPHRRSRRRSAPASSPSFPTSPAYCATRTIPIP